MAERGMAGQMHYLEARRQAYAVRGSDARRLHDFAHAGGIRYRTDEPPEIEAGSGRVARALCVGATRLSRFMFSSDCKSLRNGRSTAYHGKRGCGAVVANTRLRYCELRSLRKRPDYGMDRQEYLR